MSEAAPEQGEQPAELAEQPQEGAEAAEEPKTYDEDYVKRLRAESAKYRTEAKAASSELEKARQASMSDVEKATHEAEQRGRSAAVQEFGKRLARTEFDALAGRRNADVDTSQVLEYVDLGKFIGEDGEPDSKAIASAVERLVPAPSGGVPSFDGGSRTPPASRQDMNTVLRKAAGRA